MAEASKYEAIGLTLAADVPGEGMVCTYNDESSELTGREALDEPSVWVVIADVPYEPWPDPGALTTLGGAEVLEIERGGEVYEYRAPRSCSIAAPTIVVSLISANLSEDDAAQDIRCDRAEAVYRLHTG